MNDCKYNPLAEFSVVVNEPATLTKCRKYFLRFFKKSSATWIYVCDLSVSLISSEIYFPQSGD